MTSVTSAAIAPRSSRLPALSLAALGVVFGDIGTSPLYAFREALHAATPHGASVAPDTVLGLLSLILWALILVVAVKYVLVLLRADNHGEGGTLSLMALARQAWPRADRWLLGLGLVGAALFFGDAMITPAISVLSAVEGVVVVRPALAAWVVPASLVVLCLLFLVQSRGTTMIARFFGPVMVLWFVTIGVAGLWQALQAPQVLTGLNPLYAARFLATNGTLGLVVLGAAFLAVTGAEALYADMGHFGRKPIVLAWLGVAFPALMLNYFGQAAVILVRPESIANPFYSLFPAPLVLPAVILAAAATVIAGQAVISGAFSLTRQAVQLHLLPRLRIRHTSDEQEGQIYVPVINGLLAAGVTLLVATFGTSTALAAAYGISVTGTMLVTTLLAAVVARFRWGWAWGSVALVFGAFVATDLVFLGANLVKIPDGGWLPLLIAAFSICLMWSWQRGVHVLAEHQQKTEIPVSAVITQLASPSVAVIPGTGVYLTTHLGLTPTALLHCLKHFRGLHAQILLVAVHTANQPVVPPESRITVESPTPRLSLVTLSFGYAETPDVPKALMQHFKEAQGGGIMTTSFILSRRRLRLAAHNRLPRWQARLFIWCARNAAGPTDYFRLPAGRVVEIGTQVNI